MPETKDNGMTYVDPVNDILQRMHMGVLTQDLNQIEVELIESKFGRDWFHELGYDKLKPNKKPIFNTAL